MGLLTREAFLPLYERLRSTVMDAEHAFSTAASGEDRAKAQRTCAKETAKALEQLGRDVHQRRVATEERLHREQASLRREMGEALGGRAGGLLAAQEGSRTEHEASEDAAASLREAELKADSWEGAAAEGAEAAALHDEAEAMLARELAAVESLLERLRETEQVAREKREWRSARI